MKLRPEVSLIVVSHSRPTSLDRLLRSLKWQTLQPAQLIIVADRRPKSGEPFEFVPLRGLNISAARNLGLARAWGDIVAYCDDDCIPEPGWLEELAAPFRDRSVSAAGGYVRGRNGVSFQSKAVMTDRSGCDSPVPSVAGTPWSCPDTPDGFVVKTVGTNCAFRTRALRRIGGFDSGFHFYLEEVDVNFRLAKAGWRTAIVPGAQVQHERHAGPHRAESGAPAGLLEISASQARFLAKHGCPQTARVDLDAFRSAQRQRLDRFVSAGHLTIRAAAGLMGELEAGIAEGPVRQGEEICSDVVLENGAGRRPAGPAPLRVTLIARPFRRRLARRLATRLARAGCAVTLIDFRPGLRRLRVRFTDDDYWHHRGGAFCRSLPEDALFRIATMRQRSYREAVRIASARRTDLFHEVAGWSQAQCRRNFESALAASLLAGGRRMASESGNSRFFPAAALLDAIVSPQYEL